MLRHKSLIPLSHQHQHALALCVRIDRAQPISAADLPAWRVEIAQQFEQEIKLHFTAEENVLFPAACQFPELISLVKQLLADHGSLRKSFAEIEAGLISSRALSAFAQKLSAHIRSEERQLFERLQQLMTKKALDDLGIRLECALEDVERLCQLTNETKSKPRK